MHRRLAGILCELCRGRTWIGAVVEHGQTVSVVAPRKMVESLGPLDSVQARSIQGWVPAGCFHSRGVMFATTLDSELKVDRCAHRCIGGNFRQVPILRDLVSGRFGVPGQLGIKTLYRSGSCRYSDRRRLWRVTKRWTTVYRCEVVIRTGIQHVQTVPGAALRWTKRSHLLYSKNAGRIERWRTTRPV